MWGDLKYETYFTKDHTQETVKLLIFFSKCTPHLNIQKYDKKETLEDNEIEMKVVVTSS